MSTTTSVDNLLLTNIEVKNDNDDGESIISIPVSSGGRHIYFTKPNKRHTSPGRTHYLVYNTTKHPDMNKAAYCNIGSGKNRMGGCVYNIQIKFGTSGLK